MSMKCLDLSSYKTLAFDCDGVILNSNKVKTEAFYQSALPYGEVFAKKLVEYHIKNGGVSRYKKFDYFLLEIVRKTTVDAEELKSLLEVYAKLVMDGLLSCEVAPGLTSLKSVTKNARWLVVSGGDQNELIDVFKARGLIDMFDAGIFGSPDTKDVILTREINNNNIIFPALFLGDSQYDLESSKRANLDFMFVSAWSESKYGFDDADYICEYLGLYM